MAKILTVANRTHIDMAVMIRKSPDIIHIDLLPAIPRNAMIVAKELKRGGYVQVPQEVSDTQQTEKEASAEEAEASHLF